MNSDSETNGVTQETKGSPSERSTVEFPYTDLDSAVEVVRGVHNAGGTACDSDQLAAQLNLEAKGGGFRLRVTGAKIFGLITYERGGRTTLTELGRQIIDPLQERQARVNAFLSVELYQKVFEQFKGGPLPPPPGLERALVTLGVGAGVKDKARQILQRSAKQAGFFEHAPDRLVRPAIKQEQPQKPTVQQEEKHSSGAEKNGSGGGGDGLHPLIQGLLMTLPKSSGTWPIQERLNWLVMANSIFKMIYPAEGTDDVTITLQQK